MPLSLKERRRIRKILAEKYTTYDAAQRIAADIDLTYNVDRNADIITVWNSILKAAEEQGLWADLVELLEEEGVNLSLKNTEKTARSVGFEEDAAADDSPNLLFKNHLLLIGIDDYKNGISKLNNAVSDIKAFKEIALKRYQFSANHCYELIDHQANRKNIINKIRELQGQLTAEDNLLFYFSGHGELDKQTHTGYWIPADATAGEVSSYISNNEIRHLLQGFKTQHTFGIVDACFSGAMFMKATAAAVKRYYNIPSRWLMTSGLEEVVPDGAPGHHSPFAASLLTQLRNNFQPALSTNELWGQMREGVIANSKQTPRCEPLSNAGHQGGEFFFLRKDANFDQIPTTAQIDANTPLRQIAQTSAKSLQTQLQQLVATDDLYEAFTILNDKLSESSSHKNLVLGRMGAYNGLRRRVNQGIVSEEHARIQTAQIRQAVLYVIEELEEEDLKMV